MAVDRFERILTEIRRELTLRFASPDDPGLFERRKRLRTLFGAVFPADAGPLRDRLGESATDDELSKSFHRRLSDATIRELLGILASRSALLEDTPSDVPSEPEGGETGQIEIALTSTSHPAGDGIFLTFLFAGGAYGSWGERFCREWYPEHDIHRATSLEEMMETIAGQLRKSDQERAGRIAELVLVTHANEFGCMQIPVTKDSGLTTPVTPWTLATLGHELKDGQHAEFRQAREAVIGGLDETSMIIIRGCWFGLSNAGLAAISAWFGGRARVYAPIGVQGFEAHSVPGGHEAPIHDWLARQGLLPRERIRDAEATKAAALRTIVKRHGGSVPAQFFILSERDYGALKLMPKRDQAGPAAEWVKTRTATPDPRLKHRLSALSREELITLAKDTLASYRVEQAPALLAMHDTWFGRLAGEPPAGGAFDPEDPLGGLPPASMGDANQIAPDASLVGESRIDVWRSSIEAGTPEARDGKDPLLAGDLQAALPDAETRRRAEQEFDEPFLNQLAAGGMSGEAAFSDRGFAFQLPDGGLRLWNFHIGRSSLREEFAGPLATFARETAANAEAGLVVTGHASTPGGETVNQRIALARAQVVSSMLVKEGIPAARIVAVGQGEHDPLIADARGGTVDQERAARNRRVDVRLVPMWRGPEVVSDVAARAVEARTMTDDLPEPVSSGEGKAGTVLDTTSLAHDVINHLLELAGAAGKAAFVSGAASLIWPIVDWIRFCVAAKKMKEAWLRQAQIIGLKVGMAAARYLAAADALATEIGASDLERVIHDPDTNRYLLDEDDLEEVKEYLRLSPIAGVTAGQRLAEVRKSLAKVAAVVNGTARAAEAELLARLRTAGFKGATLDAEYSRLIPKVRIECVRELERRANLSLKAAR